MTVSCPSLSRITCTNAPALNLSIWVICKMPSLRVSLSPQPALISRSYSDSGLVRPSSLAEVGKEILVELLIIKFPFLMLDCVSVVLLLYPGCQICTAKEKPARWATEAHHRPEGSGSLVARTSDPGFAMSNGMDCGPSRGGRFFKVWPGRNNPCFHQPVCRANIRSATSGYA